jgi:hypothetical protein
MSSLSLKKNGRISSSKQTKHIKAKYYFTKLYYDAGVIDLCYCPSEHMWADIFTKPLQDSKFWEMRVILMNCPVNYSKDPPFISPKHPPLSNTTTSDETTNQYDCTFIAGVC